MKPFEWARLVCDDDRVPPMARFVALTLAMHSRGAHAPQSRCSQQQIATWTGLCRRTVVTALGTLADLEYVVPVKQHARSGARTASIYLLIHPEDAEEQAPIAPPKPTSTRPTKVQQMHRGSATDAQAWCAGDAHLEDEGISQDASENVRDLTALIASRTRF